MARAFLSVFAPHLHRGEAVAVTAQFAEGAEVYSAQRLHDKITWKRDGRRFTPPWKFLPHDIEAQYFTVHNLLAPDKVDDDLVQHVLVELTGGIDLAGIAGQFTKSNRSRGQREAIELRAARAHLARVRGERADLERHERALTAQREQLHNLSVTLARRTALETAQQYQAVQRDLAEHEALRSEHDGVYEHLTPERSETVRSQLAHAQAATTRVQDLQARRAQLEQELHGIPDIPDAEQALLAALDAEEELHVQRQHLAQLGATLTAHEQRLTEEETATGVRTEIGEYPDGAALQAAYDIAAQVSEREGAVRTARASIRSATERLRAATTHAQHLHDAERAAATERHAKEAAQRRRLRTTSFVTGGIAIVSIGIAIVGRWSDYTSISLPLSLVATGVGGMFLLGGLLYAWSGRRTRAAWQAQHATRAEQATAAREVAQRVAQDTVEHEYELHAMYQQLRHLRTNAERIAGPIARHVANHVSRPSSHAVWLARVAELGNLTQRTALLREEHTNVAEIVATLEAEQAARVAMFQFTVPATRRVLETRLRSEMEWAAKRRQLAEVTHEYGQAVAAQEKAWQQVTDTLQRAGVPPTSREDMHALLSEQEQRWGAFAAWRDRRDELQSTRATLRHSLGADDDLRTKPPAVIAEQLAALPGLEQQRASLQQRVSQTEVRVQEARRSRVVEQAMERVQRAEQALRDHRAVTLQETALQFVYEDVMRTIFVEHEPQALQRASAWFRAFTNGEFTLRYELGQHVSARDMLSARNEKTGAVRMLGQLSSGTISQLLLAVRLAYALEREVGGKPQIPFVLDEALGTADEVRFGEIARNLELFSRETGRQLLYLSARHEDAEAWKRTSADVGVMTLQEE